MPLVGRYPGRDDGVDVEKHLLGRHQGFCRLGDAVGPRALGADIGSHFFELGQYLGHLLLHGFEHEASLSQLAPHLIEMSDKHIVAVSAYPVNSQPQQKFLVLRTHGDVTCSSNCRLSARVVEVTPTECWSRCVVHISTRDLPRHSLQHEN
ncbi:hypothetical protein GQ600_11532 [Phytophthora cactorum]|nr:hypothetical protein GQ600_11532 [Phytophthora cactorum]